MTPKEQFLETPHAAEHRKMVQTEAFREALNYSILELLEQVPSTADGAAQMDGAKKFCKILSNLADVEDVPQGTKQKTIDHDAYERPAKRATG